jgi:AbrB family looped-hinge helix DNA binding protein
MSESSTRIAAGGRIVIPAEIRRKLGAEIGDEVILRLNGSELHILTKREAIRKAQAMVRDVIPRHRSLVKELLRERREAAKHE